MTTDLINTQTISAVIVALAAFKVIETLINRLTKNGSFGINKKIDELRDNHFHELKEVLNRVDKRTEEMNLHLIKIIEILRK